MNNGAFGEGFPYTNFHDMNMDWIIKIAKDFLDQYSTIQQHIAQGLVSIESTKQSAISELVNLADSLETSLNGWYETHSEDIANELANALERLNAWYSEHEGYLDTYVTDSISDFQIEANRIAEETRQSIPSDYTALYDQVQDMDDYDESIKSAIEAHSIALERGEIIFPGVFTHGSRIGQLNPPSSSIQESTYRITNPVPVTFSETVRFYVKDGFRFRAYQFNKQTGVISYFTPWTTGSLEFSPEYTYCINIARATEDTSETADIAEFMQAVYMSPFNMMGTGGNISAANKQAITGGNLDNLPAKKVYGVASDADLDNQPVSGGGLVFGLSQFPTVDTAQSNGRPQFFIDRLGRLYTRIYWVDHFTDWVEASNDSALKTTNTNITNENANDVCGADLDNLPAKRFYGIAAGTELDHVPEGANGGAVFGLCQQLNTENAQGNGRPQFYVDQYGHLFTRIYWANNFTDWKPTTYNSALKTGNANINSTNKNLYMENGDLDNLPAKMVYGVAGGAELENRPTDIGGMVFGLSQQETGDSAQAAGRPQFYISATGEVYSRIFWNGAFSTWKKPVYNLNALWSNLKVLTLGDSIARGGRNGGKGFIGDTGCIFCNIAVGGASLSTIHDSSQSVDSAHPMGAVNIPDQLLKYTYQTAQDWYIEPDAIIAEGGINDYLFNADLGSLPTSPVHDDTSAQALDMSTISGGLQYLFYLMIKHYPRAKRYFLLSHRANTYPWRVNTTGFTQTEMNEMIRKIANLYSVEIIDVFNKSNLNSIFDEYVSPTPYRDDPSVTNLYYVDNDRLHPLALGYKEAYAPLVTRALMSTYSD